MKFSKFISASAIALSLNLIPLQPMQLRNYPDVGQQSATDKYFFTLLNHLQERELVPDVWMIIKNYFVAFKLEDIKLLAQDINCDTPEKLCDSINALILTKSPDNKLLIPAIKYAFSKTTNSILMTDTRGATALHYACLKGYTDCVNALITVAASINDDKKTLQKLLFAQDQSDHTPLHKACFNDHIQCANALITAVNSIDIDDDEKTLQSLLLINDRFGYTALHLACYLGHTDCANMLKEIYHQFGISLPEGL